MDPSPEDAELAELAELIERTARYDRSGLLGKAARLLAQRAPGAREREIVRRHGLRAEERIAEDAVRVVLACEPVWALIARHGMPEDASTRELNDITRHLVGRRTRRSEPPPHLSIRAARDPLRLAVVTSLLPELPQQVDSYRYAAIDEEPPGAPSPFLVLLRDRPRGDSAVVATVHLGATFLRYEQEFGLIHPDRLETLATVVAQDLDDVARTYRELRAI